MKNQFDDMYKKTANEASAILCAFGDIMQEQEELEKENTNLQSEIFRLVWHCALMIEKYHDTVFSKSLTQML